MNRLLWRALLAFLVLPGTVAFAVPLLLLADVSGRSFDLRALVLLAPGLVLLLWCVHTFYAAGRGTLAPWSPPRKLVVTGPYGLSRNPMYIAVVLLLWGWAVGFHSLPLALYAVAVLPAFHLYEARHINGPQGTYKGYRLEDLERPEDPDRRLEWEQ